MVLSARATAEEHGPPHDGHSEGTLRLWLALSAPPVAWFAAQSAGYFFVPWSCARTNGEWILHGIALTALLICIASGLLALGVLRDIGAHGADDHDDRIQRTRFLARLGMLGATIFALIMIVQWIAIGILDPCMPWPRSPFTPDAALPLVDYLLA